MQIQDWFEMACIFGGVVHLIPYLSLLIVVAVGRENQKLRSLFSPLPAGQWSKILLFWPTPKIACTQ